MLHTCKPAVSRSLSLLKMDAVTSYGQQFPVSVWMKKVSSTDSSRVIVIIEPVERSSAHFAMNMEVRCCATCVVYL